MEPKLHNAPPTSPRGAPASVPTFGDWPQVWTDGMHMGRGIMRKISPTANTDLTITHNLGRIPNTVIVFDGGDNAANPPANAYYLPKWKRSIVTAWSTSKITVQFDTTTVNTWIWIG